NCFRMRVLCVLGELGARILRDRGECWTMIEMDAVAYPLRWRIASAVLVTIVGASYLLLFAASAFPDRAIVPVIIKQAVVPIVMALGVPQASEFRVFFIAAFAIALIVIPATAAWLIRRGL